MTPPADRSVREAMRHGVVLCDAEATVREVARAMRDHGVRAVLALDLSGEAVGLVAERDLLKAWDQPDTARAADVMDPDPLILDPAEAVSAAAARMLAAGATRAVVAPPPPAEGSGRWSEWKERGLPAGLLTVADLLSRADQLEAARLRPAPAPAGRRVPAWLAFSSLLAVVLVLGLLIFVALHTHPSVQHPGCAIPTQGGC